MIKFIHDSWEGIMNADMNPLRHIPDLQVRHLAIQLLAWMWCIAFSLYFGSLIVSRTSQDSLVEGCRVEFF